LSRKAVVSASAACHQERQVHRAHPFGYRLAEDGKGLEVVEQEAEMLRGILENIAEGSSPYCKANRLNSEGVPALGWHFGRAGRKYGDA
jgi:hypothetical protein